MRNKWLRKPKICLKYLHRNPVFIHSHQTATYSRNWTAFFVIQHIIQVYILHDFYKLLCTVLLLRCVENRRANYIHIFHCSVSLLCTAATVYLGQQFLALLLFSSCQTVTQSKLHLRSQLLFTFNYFGFHLYCMLWLASVKPLAWFSDLTLQSDVC